MPISSEDIAIRATFAELNALVESKFQDLAAEPLAKRQNKMTLNVLNWYGILTEKKFDDDTPNRSLNKLFAGNPTNTFMHIFLRKVGGGYIFVHRLLLEYFASLEPEEEGG